MEKKPPGEGDTTGTRPHTTTSPNHQPCAWITISSLRESGKGLAYEIIKGSP